MRWLSLVLLASCAADPSTGAHCPSTRAPTYAGFGRAFFASYCTGCHSAASRDRHGAPSGIDFDDEAHVKYFAHAIDIEAAAGPDSVNTDMPDMTGPVHAAPTLAERETLGEFLACER